jgi:short-subunit dehydrogenase
VSRSKKYALITGASAGIGKALAVACAQQGRNVILVALPGALLEEAAREIQTQYSVKVQYYGIDLSSQGAALEIYQWCKQERLSVDLLINNAGMGAAGAFDEFDYRFYETMLQLNVMTLVLLTRLFLDDLKAQPKAGIINLGSAASFFDVPYKLVYSSSKSFIYSFSRALRQELRGSNIQVTVVCPGGVNTSPEVMQRTKEAGKFAEAMLLEPSFVAEKALSALAKGRAVSTPGFIGTVYRWASWIVPYNLQMRWLSAIFSKSKKNTPVKAVPEGLQAPNAALMPQPVEITNSQKQALN